jgi:hypothetical protein
MFYSPNDSELIGDIGLGYDQYPYYSPDVFNMNFSTADLPKKPVPYTPIENEVMGNQGTRRINNNYGDSTYMDVPRKNLRRDLEPYPYRDVYVIPQKENIMTNFPTFHSFDPFTSAPFKPFKPINSDFLIMVLFIILIIICILQSMQINNLWNIILKPGSGRPS